MNEMSKEKKCPNCGNEKMEPVGEIRVKLPTPSREKVFGGPSPHYSTTVQLPFNYCTVCAAVIYNKPEESRE